jgi:hypothetical protein
MPVAHPGCLGCRSERAHEVDQITLLEIRELQAQDEIEELDHVFQRELVTLPSPTSSIRAFEVA